MTSDFECEWSTHPLPQVVLTSSKRDARTLEAKAVAGSKSIFKVGQIVALAV